MNVDLSAQGIEPYDFDPHFEREVVIYLCKSDRFWNLYGPWVNPDLFRAPPARLAIEIAKLVAKETERAPGGIAVVLQRLTEERKRGKREQSEIAALVDWFEDGFDSPLGLSTEDSVIERVRSVLQKDLRRVFVEKAILGLNPGKENFDALAAEIATIQSIGRDERKFGTIIGAANRSAWQDIRELRNAERITVGVESVNRYLSGGANRGGLFVWVAEPGFGKSMACSTSAGDNFREGRFVHYISAELAKGEVDARVKANITGIPIDLIKDDLSVEHEVNRRIDHFGAKGGLVVVSEVTAYATTVQDCIELAKREQDRAKRKIDLLIIDPADRLAAPKEKSDYAAARVIYDGFRGFIHEEKIFGMTACQATRKKTGKDQRKVIDLPDMADSIHKARIADIVVSINEDPEGGGLFFFVAKHRTGNARKTIGTFRHDFARARLVRERGPNDEELGEF